MLPIDSAHLCAERNKMLLQERTRSVTELGLLLCFAETNSFATCLAIPSATPDVPQLA
jgi:hypothetical protein